ncbi:hypothetical protein ABFS82_06G193700 [Erythranthe guttata]
MLRLPQAAASIHTVSKQLVTSSFGIAFDIDGVILRGANPIGNSSRALRRLYDDSGALKIPFLFLTNGGGIPEARRAVELSNILEVNILPSQVVQGHSPFRNLLKRYENEFIVATGKGEPAVVMSEYGFKQVVSLDEYATHFNNIDPVAQYKKWSTRQELNCTRNSEKTVSNHIDYSQKVKAAFVVSDPVDWGRDIQVFPERRIGINHVFILLLMIFNTRLHFPQNASVWVHLESPLRVSSTEFMTNLWNIRLLESQIHLFSKILKLY